MNAMNHLGETAFMIACEDGGKDVVQLFLVNSDCIGTIEQHLIVHMSKHK